MCVCVRTSLIFSLQNGATSDFEMCFGCYQHLSCSGCLNQNTSRIQIL